MNDDTLDAANRITPLLKPVLSGDYGDMRIWN